MNPFTRMTPRELDAIADRLLDEESVDCLRSEIISPIFRGNTYIPAYKDNPYQIPRPSPGKAYPAGRSCNVCARPISWGSRNRCRECYHRMAVENHREKTQEFDYWSSLSVAGWESGSRVSIDTEES